MWEISLPIWYLPCVAILAGGAIGVWSVTRLFLLSEGKEPIPIEFDDEIHAVYPVSGLLCVVSELSVSMYDPERARLIDRYQANDVLGISWWEGDRLLIASVTGAPLMFRPGPDSVGYLGL